MRNYHSVAELSPAGFFGLPDGDRCVVPARDEPQQLAGAFIHVKSGTPVGWGTLPKYRTEEEIVRLKARVGGLDLNIHDNIVEAEVPGDSVSAAFEAFSSALRRYTMLLSVAHGGHFEFRVIGVETEVGAFYPGPKQFQSLSFIQYHLSQMRTSLEDAATYSQLGDARLDAALRNHKYGLFLSDLRLKFDLWSSEHSSIVGSAFLAFWKAVTCIVGDPSSDRDHQSRYRSIGLPTDFMALHYEPLKRLRDHHDIAHYSLSQESLEDVKASLGKAARTSRLVLSTFCQHLSRERLAT